jgi:hypothetical protein
LRSALSAKIALAAAERRRLRIVSADGGAAEVEYRIGRPKSLLDGLGDMGIGLRILPWLIAMLSNNALITAACCSYRTSAMGHERRIACSSRANSSQNQPKSGHFLQTRFYAQLGPSLKRDRPMDNADKDCTENTSQRVPWNKGTPAETEARLGDQDPLASSTNATGSPT